MNKKRIAELRKALVDENISYHELLEIDGAAAVAGVTVTEDMLAEDILDALEDIKHVR